MRSKVLGILFGGGLLAATVVPALACSYNTQASSGQGQQQTAQAQDQSQTKTQ